MAKTLLNSVNEVLKRVGQISGDAGLLSSLTDSPRQRWIDVSVQVINEGIDDLYAATPIAQPTEQGQDTITLVTGTRDYTLNTAVIQLRWPFIDRTNKQYLHDYPGGYDAMLRDDPEQDDTGLPQWATIRPTDGKLFLDCAPTSVENGRIYYYQYDKNLGLSAASDTVPFNDAVFRAMVPVWAQLYRRDVQNSFDGDLYRVNVGRAAGLLSTRQARTDYLNR